MTYEALNPAPFCAALCCACPQVEAVAKDLGQLGREGALAAVLADAPELAALLQELKGSVDEVRGAAWGP